MTNLKILLKNNFNILLGTLQGKRKRKSTLIAGSLLVLGAIGIIALYTLQAVSMYSGLGELGLNKLCLFHGITTTLAVVLIISVMRSSVNEKNNDADFLLSLPIKKRDIVISKTVNKYLFDFFFVLMMFVPYLVIYEIRTGFSVSALLCGLLLAFLLPLLSVGLSYLFDFVISRLFNKFKYSGFLKSLTSTMLYIVILGLMLLKTSFYGTVQFESMDAYFADRPLSNLCLNFTLNHDILSIVIVLAITIIPFIIGLVLYSLNLGKNFASYHSNKKELKFNNEKGYLGLLVKKELGTYTTTPAYFINTIIGPILMLGISILIAVTGKAGIENMLMMSLPNELLVGFIVLAFAGINSLTTISSSSVSLEGKTFWLLKSSPINEKYILLSKALTHIIIVEPFIIASSIILSIALKFSIIEFLFVLILPTLANMIMAFGGVLINLVLPKLEYENETQVVKQSMAVLISMLFGLVITLIPLGEYYLFKTLSILTLCLITLGIYALILAVCIFLVFTKGIKLFRSL